MPKVKTVFFYLPKIAMTACAKKIPNGFLKLILTIVGLTLFSLAMIASWAKSLNATKVPRPLSLLLNKVANIGIDYIILINILFGAWLRGFPSDYNKTFWRCINFNWPLRITQDETLNKKPYWPN